MSTHQGLTITPRAKALQDLDSTIEQLVAVVEEADGLFECTCGRYMPKQIRVGSYECMENNYVTSDVLPEVLFCSTSCRNEAEQAAEDARRSDRVSR